MSLFDKVRDEDLLWVPSFIFQQLVAGLITALLGFIGMLLYPIAPSFVGFPLLTGLLSGYSLQWLRPSSIKAGKWVSVLPTVLIIVVASDWRPRVSWVKAIEYTFSPPRNSGEQGIGVLFTIPAYSSWAYVAGLLIASHQQRRTKRG